MVGAGKHSAYNGPASKTRMCRYYVARSNNHFGKTCSYMHPCKTLLMDGACRHGRRCTDDHVCVAHLLHGDTLPHGCTAGDTCHLLHVRHESDRAALVEMVRDWLALREATAGAEAGYGGSGSEELSGGVYPTPRVLCPFWYVETCSGCKAGADCIYDHPGQVQLGARPLPTPAQLRFAEKAWEKRRLQDAARGTWSPPGPLPFSLSSASLAAVATASLAGAAPRGPMAALTLSPRHSDARCWPSSGPLHRDAAPELLAALAHMRLGAVAAAGHEPRLGGVAHMLGTWGDREPHDDDGGGGGGVGEWAPRHDEEAGAVGWSGLTTTGSGMFVDSAATGTAGVDTQKVMATGASGIRPAGGMPPWRTLGKDGSEEGGVVAHPTSAPMTGVGGGSLNPHSPPFYPVRGPAAGAGDVRR